MGRFVAGSAGLGVVRSQGRVGRQHAVVTVAADPGGGTTAAIRSSSSSGVKTSGLLYDQGGVNRFERLTFLHGMSIRPQI